MTPREEGRLAEAQWRCAHPSLRCSTCGKMYDMLRPGECQRVIECVGEVRALQATVMRLTAALGENAPSPGALFSSESAEEKAAG